MPNRILTDEQAEELYNDRKIGGWTVVKCAEYYGISRGTVTNEVKRIELKKLERNTDRPRYPNGRAIAKNRIKPKTKPLMPCGTDAAYQRHKRSGEYPCTPCLEAHAASVKKYKDESKKKLSSSVPITSIHATMGESPDETQRMAG